MFRHQRPENLHNPLIGLHQSTALLWSVSIRIQWLGHIVFVSVTFSLFMLIRLIRSSKSGGIVSDLVALDKKR